MTQIGNVPEINAVKKQLEELKGKDLVKDWELPYEGILTRLTTAIFFLTPTDESKLDNIWKELKTYNIIQYSENKEEKLSRLRWRVEFNQNTLS